MSNTTSGSNEAITAKLLRFAGYGLLLFSLANFADALLPPRFGQDPAWEFEALRKSVGTAPVPIIGLILVFYGESTARSPLGRNILKALSWLSLVLGIFFSIFLVVGISAVIRINTNLNTQASFVLSQQVSQFNTAKESLKNTDDRNLQRAAEFIERRSPDIKLDKTNPTVLRSQIEAEILKNEKEIKDRVQTGQEQAFRQLLKQSSKAFFEAIVAAVVLFGIWSQSKWARSKNVVRKKKKGGKSSSMSLADVASTPTLGDADASIDDNSETDNENS